ncbi:SAM-dependent methyltransferase [Shimia thalassica]|uniref:SAM-dependent methyltransferase n=1 Tax=Shimia thalassica TaxID=1715693 RepID=UPI0026E2433E|nr:SAM-dependent methyltransferase [Shimia thalassica]MDO6481558.1 SAM-dependent methyltransferase [Shimia thalassica]
MTHLEARAGEVELDFDPTTETDASVMFIGRIRSPWKRGDCPANIRKARERTCEAWIELDSRLVQGLNGLKVGQQIVLIYWMHETRRDIIVQSPRHSEGTRGVFSLRSPLRPNPLAMSSVRITSLDPDRGNVGIDAIDCFDGTPLVDIKPWVPTIDLLPDE